MLASLSLLAVLVLDPLASGLTQPVQIVSAHDGSGRLFIAQENSRILIHDGVAVHPRPFLDLSSVTCCENGGLLSVVFHPRYRENGELFVLYVDRNVDTAVARYRRSPSDPDLALPSSGELLFTVPQPKGIGGNHHGGTLQFGPDGMLYISIGDGGNGEHVLTRAQDLQLRAGKLLRIDVDRGSPYAVPPDNPFLGAPGVPPEIYAYGFRNPWRFSFDRLTGELLLGDVGQHSWEELDVVTLAEARGANFGWPLMEGMHCYPPGSECDEGGLVLPALEYPLLFGNCSVNGGYRYRGKRWPALEGRYLYGDFCTGRIWAAWEEGGRWASMELADTGMAIVSFGEDDDGELYVVDYNGTVSRVTFPDSRRRSAR